MSKIDWIRKVREVTFQLDDIREDKDGNFHLGLKAAKDIADRLWNMEKE